MSCILQRLVFFAPRYSNFIIWMYIALATLSYKQTYCLLLVVGISFFSLNGPAWDQRRYGCRVLYLCFLQQGEVEIVG